MGFPIRYGVEISNPTDTPVQLQIYGTGFTIGDFGGEPFRQLFEFERKHPVPTLQVLRPGERLWLLNPPQAIPQRAFLSGVGVVYTVSGKVTNAGTRARCVVVTMQVTSPDQTAKIAYHDRTATWRQARLVPQQQIDYYRFTVPGGQTKSYDATFVLGGSSSSALRQSISVAPDLASCR
jgi:hypothetical protein